MSRFGWLCLGGAFLVASLISYAIRPLPSTIAPFSPSVASPAPSATPPTAGPLEDSSDIAQSGWVKHELKGQATISSQSGTFRVQAGSTNPGSSATLTTSETFSGDIDLTVEFNHAGHGRTDIGLWSRRADTWGPHVALDTDDTNYLNFMSGKSATEWKFPGTPYMNRWVTLRIRTVGNQATFFVDGNALETMVNSYAGDTFWVAISVGSISWKSGPNDTSFRLVKATANP